MMTKGKGSLSPSFGVTSCITHLAYLAPFIISTIPFLTPSNETLATLQTMATAPRSVPAELVESIVSFLWSFRLSRDERITLMTSMPLFNSTWRNAYIRASTKDVYIPCASYADHFFSILRGESRFYDKARLEAGCRSITFAISLPRAPQQRSTTNHPAGIVMADILRFISDDSFSRVQNLRKIAIHYHNIGLDDIFDNSRLVDFPSQVTELEIVHTFSPEMPEFLASELRDEEEYCCPRYILQWHMPNIRYLALAGVGGCYVGKMVTACTNVVNLELDLSYGPPREIFFCAPDSLQRFILHSPVDVEPSQEVLSPASAHVERLFSVHYPAREICLMPARKTYGWHYGRTRADNEDDFLIQMFYPANLMPGMRWI